MNLHPGPTGRDLLWWGLGMQVHWLHMVVDAGIELFVPADVPGLLGAFRFFGVRAQDRALDEVAGGCFDWVRDIDMEPSTAVHVADGTLFIQPPAAVVAEAGPQVVLGAARGAAVGQLAAGHGHEPALGALDDLEVAHHEHVVEGDGAES